MINLKEILRGEIEEAEVHAMVELKIEEAVKDAVAHMNFYDRTSDLIDTKLEDIDWEDVMSDIIDDIIDEIISDMLYD